jgi:hypothetical protein
MKISFYHILSLFYPFPDFAIFPTGSEVDFSQSNAFGATSLSLLFPRSTRYAMYAQVSRKLPQKMKTLGPQTEAAWHVFFLWEDIVSADQLPDAGSKSHALRETDPNGENR